MSRKDAVLECYRSDYNCAQSILSGFAGELGLDREYALKISCGLGAGMGRMAGVCGAVSGSFLILGMVYGMTDPLRQEDKELNYRMVRDFAERFKRKNSSITCSELMGCDVSTESGFEQAKAQNLTETVCEKLLEDAVVILEEMI